MEYGQLLKNSLKIAWERKYLWAFGFFAGVGMPNTRGVAVEEKLGDAWAWLTSNPGLLILVLVLAGILSLVFLVLQVVSQGGLIKSASAIERGQPSSFELALNAGLQSFWRVLGLELLLVVLLLAGMVAAIVPPVAMIAAGPAGLKVLGIVWIVLAILPFIAAVLGAALLWNYALRFVVIDDRPIGRSLSLSWNCFKQCLSESVILFAISLGFSIAITIAVVAALVVLAIPFIILGLVNPILGLVPGLLVGIPVLVVAICVLGVFSSAYWTLGFLRLPCFKQAAPPGAPAA